MFRKLVIRLLGIIQKALLHESEQTRQVILGYYKFIQGDSSEEELQKTNLLLKNILKDLGFGFLVILPFSPITIPLIAKLSQRYDVDIFPEWFKDSLKK
jgi:hypothetical protein|tara:strand:+ start:911 stop:1207 length:297 start_codon:yes stop_codon:yes gene_type:complete